jgi:DNA repair protein RadC
MRLVKEKSIKYPVEAIGDAKQAEIALRAYLHQQDCEHLVVLMLDARNDMIGMSTVTTGGISGLSCAVRDIFKYAIVGRASGIILGHNHPSGDCTPSQEDLNFTSRVKEAGQLLGVPLIDHLIISSGAREGRYSLLEHHLI